MKTMIIVDIPETENIADPLSPFNIKVILDYGDKVIAEKGEIYSGTPAAENTEVILDMPKNEMRCPHCDAILGGACDYTPRFCSHCGNILTGGWKRGVLQ